jgi:NifU-like N terminal domain
MSHERNDDTTMGVSDYSPLVRELFEHPRAGGIIADDAGDVAHGEAGSVDAGAWVRLHLKIERGRVTDARFQAYGCPHTLAAAEWLAEHLPGRPTEDPLPEGVEGLARILAVPVSKRGRLLIVEDALTDALRRRRGRE